MPMPIEIVGLGKDSVCFTWTDQHQDIFTAQRLRCMCTCAYCQSETTGERLLDPATIPDDITVTAMELTGNYGVNIHFSDGHSTGIYRFKILEEAARSAEAARAEEAAKGE